MKHLFPDLKPEYTRLLAAMQITRLDDANKTALRLLGNRHRYQPVASKTGIPLIWIAASFEREASSDFRRSPAQGDFWNVVSTHVPKGRGPFPDWVSAALDAYALNGLDKIGAGNWTWELCCFYGETFNGFGYRDYHQMPSPYLWGGTSVQKRGKYTADGHFDPTKFDTQLGIIPIMKRMVAMDPTLEIGQVVVPDPSQSPLAGA